MNRIRELRRARGLTLEALAQMTGTTNQQISRLEKGERRLHQHWMEVISKALGVMPADLLPGAEAAAGSAAPGAASGPSGDLIPVRSAARGGDEQEMFLEDGPIDYQPRPAVLRNVRDAYSIYVVGDSMSPRYRAGMLLHINPFKPSKRENGVVVYKANNAVLIKEFVELTRTHLVLRQYNPDRLIELPREEIAQCHTVVGSEEA